MNAYPRGQQIKELAHFWINQSKLRAEAAAGALTISVRDATGYAANDVLILNPGAETQEKPTIAAVLGTVVTLTVALTYAHGRNEIVGELSDPTTVLLQVQTPDGLDTPYTLALTTVTRESVGTFYRLLSGNQSGEWVCHWESTGSPEAGFQHKFVVEPMEF